MWSIKIVGISGSGKTTLINSIKNIPFHHMCYSYYLKQYNDKADEEWDENLAKTKDLILIDEHLEIGERDLFEQYKKENTTGIIFIEVTYEELRKRINGDINRKRPEITSKNIETQQSKARNKAFSLAKKLKIPFVVIRDKNLDDSIKLASKFIMGIKTKRRLLIEQESLKLNLTEIDLNTMWNSHWLLSSLRKEVYLLVLKYLNESEFPFDPQDLEHQALFYLTTISPGRIKKSDIEEAVKQQYIIIKDRIRRKLNKKEANYLFRGLKEFYPDLNSRHRLNLIRRDSNLFAIGDGRRFEVVFKKVDPKDKIVSLFTETLHYVHNKRTKGDVFAFYFKGDRYPWAIETTESGTFARQYKRNALLAHGINPDNAIELTRMYSLPGSPLSCISLMDGLIRNYYKKNGTEALFTCTMPAYSKTKSTTIAGGLDRILCMRKLEHLFIPTEIEGKICWRMSTSRELERKKYTGEQRATHPDFYLLPKIDVYGIIQKKSSLNPLSKLKNKVIYFNT